MWKQKCTLKDRKIRMRLNVSFLFPIFFSASQTRRRERMLIQVLMISAENFFKCNVSQVFFLTWLSDLFHWW